MSKRFLITAALLAGTLSACPSASGGAGNLPGGPGDNGDVSGARPGIASGMVKDTQGRPLGGVQVVLDNTIYANSGQTVTTGADGRYSFRVEQGSWRLYAEITREYNGRTYELDLHPDRQDSFAGVDGVVRNFEWRLTGKQPSPQVGTYGALVAVYNDPVGDFYDTQNVDFTFTPVGPLIDGSAGKAFTRRHGAPRTDEFKKIVDVPIGRYKVTATYAPAGETPRPLGIRVSGEGEYERSVVADFGPELNFCTNCVTLEVSDR